MAPICVDFDKVYSTKHYGDYKIIEKLGYIHNDSRMWVRIKFIQTGFEKDIRYDYIGHDIVDPYYPRIHGVACIGEGVGARNEYKEDYDRWLNTVSRCYNKDSKDYPRYGGAGVTMSDEWLNFSNYFRDIKTLPGYRYAKQNPKEWALDKDYLQKGVEEKIYSKDTCVWLPKNINSKLTSDSYDEELSYVDRQGNLKKQKMIEDIK